MITTERARHRSAQRRRQRQRRDGSGACKEAAQQSGAAVEEVKASARGDRPRPAGGGERGRAGGQDRQPDPRPGDQGKGERHSHRAVREAAQAALPRGRQPRSKPARRRRRCSCRSPRASRFSRAWTLPSAACRRTAASASGSRARKSICVSPCCRRCTVRRSSSVCSIRARSPARSTSSAWTSTRCGIFKKAVDAPHGMILVTGPTGSGKTTTLYSRARRAEQSRIQHRHGRGPDRISVAGHQPGRGESRHRPELRRRASLDSASGPGHRHDR